MRINSQSGLLTSLKRGTSEFLHNSADTGNTPACRMQLHRAPTDNDRNGYLEMWTAEGLDQAMVPCPLSPRPPGPCDEDVQQTEAAHGAHLVDQPVAEGVTFRSQYVEMRLQRTTGAQSLHCAWSMRPRRPVNYMKRHVLKTVQNFLRDELNKEIFLLFNDPAEETFIHHLGMEFRLGRRTCKIPQGTAVRLWKAWYYLNSTIPPAEALIGGGFASNCPVDALVETGLAPIVPSYNRSRVLSTAVAEVSPEVHYEAVYTLNTDGILHVSVSVDTRSFLSPLPRVGLQLNLPLSLQQLRWQGRGPQECYPDRKASSVLAVHEVNLAHSTLHVPYVRPGENGSHADVCWVQFAAENAASDATNTGPGLRIESNSKFNFSAQRYSTKDLTQAMHINDVAAHPRPYLCVNLDPHLMGVGGDDSWSACVHEVYLLQRHAAPGVSSTSHRLYQYGFTFQML